LCSCIQLKKWLLVSSVALVAVTELHGRSLSAIPDAKNLPPVKDRSNFSNFVTINEARFLDTLMKMVIGGVILKEMLFT
jgi:hypothetical protein